jgi:hypothetical protein
MRVQIISEENCMLQVQNEDPSLPEKNWVKNSGWSQIELKKEIC